MAGSPKISRAAYALAIVMQEAGDEAAAIRAVVHRTQIWRYVHGLRQPDADTIAKLHSASGGRVPADGWRVASRKVA